MSGTLGALVAPHFRPAERPDLIRYLNRIEQDHTPQIGHERCVTCGQPSVCDAGYLLVKLGRLAVLVGGKGK